MTYFDFSLDNKIINDHKMGGQYDDIVAALKRNFIPYHIFYRTHFVVHVENSELKVVVGHFRIPTAQ